MNTTFACQMRLSNYGCSFSLFTRISEDRILSAHVRSRTYYVVTHRQTKKTGKHMIKKVGNPTFRPHLAPHNITFPYRLYHCHGMGDALRGQSLPHDTHNRMRPAVAGFALSWDSMSCVSEEVDRRVCVLRIGAGDS